MILVYFQVFLDNKLDGGCLPLLTETQLTSGLGMKLGPALKLLTALRRKLGPDAGLGCSHCSHCHHHRGGLDEPPPPSSSEHTLPSSSSLGDNGN